MPPNYDEIDPPPSYSTLFPGNKSFESPSAPAESSSIDRSVSLNISNENHPSTVAAASTIQSPPATTSISTITSNSTTTSNDTNAQHS